MYENQKMKIECGTRTVGCGTRSFIWYNIPSWQKNTFIIINSCVLYYFFFLAHHLIYKAGGGGRREKEKKSIFSRACGGRRGTQWQTPPPATSWEKGQPGVRGGAARWEKSPKGEPVMGEEGAPSGSCRQPQAGGAARWEKMEPVVGEGAPCGGRQQQQQQSGRVGSLWWKRGQRGGRRRGSLWWAPYGSRRQPQLMMIGDNN